MTPEQSHAHAVRRFRYWKSRVENLEDARCNVILIGSDDALTEYKDQLARARRLRDYWYRVSTKRFHEWRVATAHNDEYRAYLGTVNHDIAKA